MNTFVLNKQVGWNLQYDKHLAKYLTIDPITEYNTSTDLFVQPYQFKLES